MHDATEDLVNASILEISCKQQEQRAMQDQRVVIENEVGAHIVQVAGPEQMLFEIEGLNLQRN